MATEHRFLFRFQDYIPCRGEGADAGKMGWGRDAGKMGWGRDAGKLGWGRDAGKMRRGAAGKTPVVGVNDGI